MLSVMKESVSHSAQHESVLMKKSDSPCQGLLRTDGRKTETTLEGFQHFVFMSVSTYKFPVSNLTVQPALLV